MATSNDITIGVTADSKGVQAGLAPAITSLGKLGTAAGKTEAELDALANTKVSPTISVTMKDEAIKKAKADIARLRDEIARGIVMGADTKDAQRQLAQLERTLRQLEGRRPRIEVDTSGVDHAAASVASLKTGLSGLASAVPGAGLLLGKGGLLFGAGAAAVGFGKLAADMQTARLQLKALVRDGGDANALFKEVQAFANTTPFEFPELLATSKTLLAFGVSSKDVVSTMKGLGAVAAAVQAPVNDLAVVYGQMLSRGVAMSEDIMQMQTRGVPIFEAFASIMGVSAEEARKLASEGKIGKDVISQLDDELLRMFPTAISDQAASFNGKMSTFLDTARAIGTAIGEDVLPVMQGFLDTGQKIVDAIPDGMGSVALQIGLIVGAGKLLGPMFAGAAVKARLFMASFGTGGGALVGIKKGLGGVVGALGGPWGLAMTAGIGLMVAWNEESKQQEESLKDFKTQLDFTAGALSNHNREVISNRLEQQGQLKVLKESGLSMDLFQRATLGSADAQKQFEAAARGVIDASVKSTGGMTNQAQAAADSLGIMGEYSGQVRDAAGSADAVATAAGGAATAVKNLDNPVANQAAAWKDYNTKLSAAKTTLDGIVESLGILNHEALDARTANRGFEQGWDDLEAALKANGKTLDAGTEKGRKNQQALDDQAASLETLTQAQLNDARINGKSTTDILANYTKQRQALIDMAIRFGMTEKEAQNYVNTLLKTPKQLTTDVQLSGLEAARRGITDLTDPKQVTIAIKLAENEDKRLLDKLQRSEVGWSAGPDRSSGGTPKAGPQGYQPIGQQAFVDSQLMAARGFGAFPDVTLAAPRGHTSLNALPGMPSALASPATQVVVQVQDRRLSDLINVQVRNAATTAVRGLTTRKVVQVG